MQQGLEQSQVSPLGDSVTVPGRGFHTAPWSPGGFGVSPKVNAEVGGYVGFVILWPSHSPFSLHINYWRMLSCNTMFANPCLGQASKEAVDASVSSETFLERGQMEVGGRMRLHLDGRPRCPQRVLVRKPT